jgi:hypothetical protein
MMKFPVDLKQVLFCFLFLCSLSSCKKKDNVRSTRSNLMIVHASPNGSAVEVLQNLNSISSFSYLNVLQQSLTYFPVDSGFSNYKIRTANIELASWLFVNSGNYSSLFIFDSLTVSNVKYFFLNDQLDTTGIGRKSKIRLVNLSPDIDSVNLLTNRVVNPSADSVIFENSIYAGKFTQKELLTKGAYQDFFGDTTVNIKIARKQNQSVIRTYRFNFERGKIYSLVLKGYDKRNGKDSLSLAFIKHN